MGTSKEKRHINKAKHFCRLLFVFEERKMKIIETALLIEEICSCVNRESTPSPSTQDDSNLIKDIASS